MHFSSHRRRLVAALAAIGASSLLPALARAQGAPSEEAAANAYRNRGTAVPCSEASSAGTWQSPASNYTITATSMNFAFLASVSAVGDNIVLYADPSLGGATTTGPALIKGMLTRTGAGAPLVASNIAFESALAAMQKDGQYYGIVSMSQEQKVPIGVAFYEGDTEFGEWELKPGVADPTSREVTLYGDAATQLLGKLMASAPFRMTLVAGGVVYSELTTPAGDFAAFVNNLVGRMDQLAEQDRSSPCLSAVPEFQPTYDPNGAITTGCFLTTACCALIGLPDDCWELETLRRFRDGWMSRFPEGRGDIARYYREASAIATGLSASARGRARLLRLYWSVIVPAAVLIRLGANRTAYRVYRSMMLSLLGPQPGL